MQFRPLCPQEKVDFGLRAKLSGHAGFHRIQECKWRLAERIGPSKPDRQVIGRASSRQDTQQRASSPPSWITSPLFFLLASSGFTAICTDLFSPAGSRWLLNTVDIPTHTWVVDHLSKFVRDFLFEIGVSNISIVLGCLGWALCSSILLNDAVDERTESAKIDDVAPKAQLASVGSDNFKRLISLWTLYFAAGGFLLPGDNLLVSFIKHLFNRVRPSTRHKSFSFPSGHTTAVTYIVGVLLFAMLPYLLELIEVRKKEPNKAAKLGVLNNEGIQKLLQKVVQNAGKLWAFAIASTAGGRILGDVHWVTDTMAGACLGSALVSGYLIVSTGLQSRRAREDVTE